MNASALSLWLTALLCLLPGGAFATGKSKGPPPRPPAPIVFPDAAQPSDALTPYIVHLDALLALQPSGDQAVQQFCSEASGHLLVLRQQLFARQAEAPEERRPAFTAAVATCDQIAAALDERQKTVGDINASRGVHGSGKLDAPARKQNLTQGIGGGDFAKAVGSVVERDRERQFIAEGQARSAAGDKAMDAMALNRWNQRALEWRRKIAAAYANVR